MLGVAEELEAGQREGQSLTLTLTPPPVLPME